ncbi:MAG: sigma-70 family RNA polymerase sigma factor [Deltaproteobacteria bacterium]|nr:sigma-70 family RNA polymerase sigma factor [Deltaproteobacteria bacterium]MCL5277898.1 sigma-70 family RNA polymerase sigma factor [Deltaproteobacteria bacterium]
MAMDEHILLKLIRDCIDRLSVPCSALYKYIGLITSQIARRYTPSLTEEDVEDIIQTVNFKLARSGLKRFSGKTVYEFSAYLKRITVNEINSLFREKKMKPADYLDDVQADPDPPSPGDDPSESRELMQKTQEVLQDYRPEEQEAFFMHLMAYKYEEISRQFNIPISTLATRFDSIKQKIKDKMK